MTFFFALHLTLGGKQTALNCASPPFKFLGTPLAHKSINYFHVWAGNGSLINRLCAMSLKLSSVNFSKQLYISRIRLANVPPFRRRPKLLFIKHQISLFSFTLTRLPTDKCVTKACGTNSFFKAAQKSYVRGVLKSNAKTAFSKGGK